MAKMFGVFVHSANSPNIFVRILLRCRAGQSRRPYELSIFALILILQQTRYLFRGGQGRPFPLPFADAHQSSRFR